MTLVGSRREFAPVVRGGACWYSTADLRGGVSREVSTQSVCRLVTCLAAAPRYPTAVCFAEGHIAEAVEANNDGSAGIQSDIRDRPDTLIAGLTSATLLAAPPWHFFGKWTMRGCRC